MKVGQTLYMIGTEADGTPSPGVTDTLKFICDALNAKEANDG